MIKLPSLGDAGSRCRSTPRPPRSGPRQRRDPDGEPAPRRSRRGRPAAPPGPRSGRSSRAAWSATASAPTYWSPCQGHAVRAGGRSSSSPWAPTRVTMNNSGYRLGPRTAARWSRSTSVWTATCRPASTGSCSARCVVVRSGAQRHALERMKAVLEAMTHRRSDLDSSPDLDTAPAVAVAGGGGVRRAPPPPAASLTARERMSCSSTRDLPSSRLSPLAGWGSDFTVVRRS